jgi:hypothetical protein
MLPSKQPKSSTGEGASKAKGEGNGSGNSGGGEGGEGGLSACLHGHSCDVSVVPRSVCSMVSRAWGTVWGHRVVAHGYPAATALPAAGDGDHKINIHINLTYIVLGLAALYLWNASSGGTGTAPRTEISYQEFYSKLLSQVCETVATSVEGAWQLMDANGAVSLGAQGCWPCSLPAQSLHSVGVTLRVLQIAHSPQGHTPWFFHIFQSFVFLKRVFFSFLL